MQYPNSSPMTPSLISSWKSSLLSLTGHATCIHPQCRLCFLSLAGMVSHHRTCPGWSNPQDYIPCMHCAARFKHFRQCQSHVERCHKQLFTINHPNPHVEESNYDLPCPPILPPSLGTMPNYSQVTSTQSSHLAWSPGRSSGMAWSPGRSSSMAGSYSDEIFPSNFVKVEHATSSIYSEESCEPSSSSVGREYSAAREEMLAEKEIQLTQLESLVKQAEIKAEQARKARELEQWEKELQGREIEARRRLAQAQRIMRENSLMTDSNQTDMQDQDSPSQDCMQRISVILPRSMAVSPTDSEKSSSSSFRKPRHFQPCVGRQANNTPTHLSFPQKRLLSPTHTSTPRMRNPSYIQNLPRQNLTISPRIITPSYSQRLPHQNHTSNPRVMTQLNFQRLPNCSKNPIVLNSNTRLPPSAIKLPPHFLDMSSQVSLTNISQEGPDKPSSHINPSPRHSCPTPGSPVLRHAAHSSPPKSTFISLITTTNKVTTQPPPALQTSTLEKNSTSNLTTVCPSSSITSVVSTYFPVQQATLNILTTSLTTPPPLSEALSPILTLSKSDVPHVEITMGGAVEMQVNSVKDGGNGLLVPTDSPVQKATLNTLTTSPTTPPPLSTVSSSIPTLNKPDLPHVEITMGGDVEMQANVVKDGGSALLISTDSHIQQYSTLNALNTSPTACIPPHHSEVVLSLSCTQNDVPHVEITMEGSFEMQANVVEDGGIGLSTDDGVSISFPLIDSTIESGFLLRDNFVLEDLLKSSGGEIVTLVATEGVDGRMTLANSSEEELSDEVDEMKGITLKSCHNGVMAKVCTGEADSNLAVTNVDTNIGLISESFGDVEVQNYIQLIDVTSAIDDKLVSTIAARAEESNNINTSDITSDQLVENVENMNESNIDIIGYIEQHISTPSKNVTLVSDDNDIITSDIREEVSDAIKSVTASDQLIDDICGGMHILQDKSATFINVASAGNDIIIATSVAIEELNSVTYFDHLDEKEKGMFEENSSNYEEDNFPEVQLLSITASNKTSPEANKVRKKRRIDCPGTSWFGCSSKKKRKVDNVFDSKDKFGDESLLKVRDHSPIVSLQLIKRSIRLRSPPTDPESVSPPPLPSTTPPSISSSALSSLTSTSILFQCGRCSSVLQSERSWHTHCAANHGGSARLAGDPCGQNFSVEEEEKAWKDAFSLSKRVSCPRCGDKVYMSKSSMKRHLKTCKVEDVNEASDEVCDGKVEDNFISIIREGPVRGKRKAATRAQGKVAEFVRQIKTRYEGDSSETEDEQLTDGSGDNYDFMNEVGVSDLFKIVINAARKLSYQCNVCSEEFSSRENIKTHVVKEHQEELTTEEDDEDDTDEYDDSCGDEDDSDPDFIVARTRYKGRKSRASSSGLRRPILEPCPELVKMEHHFRSKYYGLNTFPSLPVDMADWVLEDKDSSFMPSLTISPKFSVKSLSSENVGGEVRVLERFRGTLINDSLMMFCGGPVSAMAWCPMDLSDNRDQVIAVVAKLDINTTMQREAGGGQALIQVWSVGGMRGRGGDPSFQFGIGHMYGSVRGLEWSPSGGKLNGRMGLLAAACGDGSVRLWAIPSLDSVREEGRIFQREADQTLSCGEGEKVGLCLAVSWYRGPGHNHIAACFSSGLVSIWDLSTTSLLLREGSTILPQQTWLAHSGSVTSVSLCPGEEEHPKYLVTGGSDRSYRFWDLRNTTVPIQEMKRGLVTGVRWIPGWSGASVCFDDVYLQGHTQTILTEAGLHSTRTIPIIAQNSSVLDLDMSHWVGTLASSTAAGELIVFVVPTLDRSMENDKNLGQRRSFVYRTDVDKDCEEELDLRVYEEMKEVCSLSFKDMPIKLDGLKDFPTKEIRRVRMAQKMGKEDLTNYPMSSITKVAWNNNIGYQFWLASGGQSGLVRFHYVAALNSNKVKQVVKDVMEDTVVKHN